jgi:tRNA (guanosine-2'-O-)-methyltransferase
MGDFLLNQKYIDYLQSYITPERLLKIESILKERTQHFTVAIEDVYQMHNASAVMRSCDVFGWQNMHVIEQKFGKRIDSEIAMGAQKWVDVQRHENAENCIQNLKYQGFQIVATVPHGDAISLNDFDIYKPSAFFFGTERHGLSEDVLSKADVFMTIPMYGFSESLNISVAASIIIQNLTERLRRSDIDWKLTPEEYLKTQLKWQKNSIKHIQSIEKAYIERVLNLK